MGTKAIFGTALAAIAAMFSTSMAQSSITETVGSVSFKMLEVKGGTYTRGCSQGSGCPTGTTPTHSVTLSDFYIGETEVTTALYNAVMGKTTSDHACNFGSAPAANNKPMASVTWYDAISFVCELNKKTEKKYRLLTDAEFEYAAREGSKNSSFTYSGSNTAADVAWTATTTSGQTQTCHGGTFGWGACLVGTKSANALGVYDLSGNLYEWVWDNWGNFSSNSGGTNPTTVHKHTQKTRRGGSHDQPDSESAVWGRKIRSIEGADGSIGIRLAYSSEYPPNMIDPCTVHQPFITSGKTGFRDERMVTGDNYAWQDVNQLTGSTGNDVLKLWADGTASYSYLNMSPPYGNQTVNGEWYSLNNFTIYIKPNSGSEVKILYLVLGTENMSAAKAGSMPSRWEKFPNTRAKPTGIAVGAPERLVDASRVVDMANPPTTGRDPLLKEGPGKAWIQNNSSAGGTHNYRTDFESDSYMRFLVWDPYTGVTTLADGTWFTIDDGFLRVTSSGGHVFDYLYTVSGTGDSRTFYHISFQGYEPGDFRMFTIYNDNDSFIGSGTAPGESISNPYESCPIGMSQYLPPDPDFVIGSSSSIVASSSSTVASSSSTVASSSSIVASSSSTVSSSSSSSAITSSSSGTTLVCAQLIGSETSITDVNRNDCFTYVCNGDFQMSASLANRATNISGDNCSKAYTVGTSYASACENATGTYTVEYTGNTSGITFNLRCIGDATPSSSSEAPSSNSGESSSSAEVTPILHQIAVNNQVMQAKNGINLQAVNNATIEIYSLSGNLISRQSYASGVYSISLAHLPKGIYLVKTQFSNGTKILRVPVM